MSTIKTSTLAATALAAAVLSAQASAEDVEVYYWIASTGF